MNPHTPPSETTVPHNAFLDSKKANMTRVFDYLTGGVTNFEVDRIAAERFMVLHPLMRSWVRLGKAFVQTAVRQLYEEGFTQFLDLGSSIPTSEGIHTFAPAANVIYSDINPVAVSYGASMFSQLENVAYIQGDVRSLESIFDHTAVKQLVKRDDMLAIGLNFLTLYLSKDENIAVSRTLFDSVPSGSKLFFTLYARPDSEEDEAYLRLKNDVEQISENFRLYTLSEYLEMMKPWQPTQIELIHTYLGLPADILPNVDGEINLDVMAAFFEKA